MIKNIRLLMFFIKYLFRDDVKVIEKEKGRIDIELQENKYLIKNISTEEEKNSFYELRHDIFVKELLWYIQKTDDNIEDDKDIDDYDEKSVLFGIFENNELIGGLRLVFSNDPRETMIHKIFNVDLFRDATIKEQGEIIEISRLFLKNNYRKQELIAGGPPVSFCLYKAINQWMIRNKFRYAYIVVAEEYYKKLNNFFEIEKLPSNNSEFDKESCVCVIDFNKSQNKLKKKNYLLYKWMMEGIKK